MAELGDEIAAYERMHADLEAAHLGEWAVVHDEELIGTYTSFDAAARVAVQRFGRGPYLIRQIGAAPVALPASALYHPIPRG
jgi:hypothetical protein